MNSIAIFCGSKAGNDSIFVETAQQVGQKIAQQGKTLVYGGGRSGLMGLLQIVLCKQVEKSLV
jgi:predicted Rossmann-fold nucleotide-binding protein